MSGTSVADQAENRAELVKLGRNLNTMAAALRLGAAESLAKIAVVITNEIKLELSRPGTGITYYRGSKRAGTRVAHVASAPGEPPAPDTGQYRASWHWVPGDDVLGPYVDIGTNMQIGVYLEFGTIFMAPRPHLRPVIERSIGEIRSMVARTIAEKQTEALRSLYVGGKGIL